MKTITYNPETHVLVPREPSVLMAETGWDDAVEHEAENIDIYDIAAIYRTMIEAAPQPEPVDVWSVGWKHDCAALCANDIELWIDRCPHCGKPRHNHPPTDDELLNKAEQVESEPVAWMNTNGAFNHMKKAEQDALHAEAMSKLTEMVRAAQKPQPDRVAELEAALKVARDALRYYGGDKYGTFANEAYAKINEVLHD